MPEPRADEQALTDRHTAPTRWAVLALLVRAGGYVRVTRLSREELRVLPMLASLNLVELTPSDMEVPTGVSVTDAGKAAYVRGDPSTDLS